MSHDELIAALRRHAGYADRESEAMDGVPLKGNLFTTAADALASLRGERDALERRCEQYEVLLSGSERDHWLAEFTRVVRERDAARREEALAHEDAERAYAALAAATPESQPESPITIRPTDYLRYVRTPKEP